MWDLWDLRPRLLSSPPHLYSQPQCLSQKRHSVFVDEWINEWIYVLVLHFEGPMHFLFSLLPSCWLHSKTGFIWAFLGPVCAIFSVSYDIRASLTLSWRSLEEQNCGRVGGLQDQECSWVVMDLVWFSKTAPRTANSNTVTKYENYLTVELMLDRLG